MTSFAGPPFSASISVILPAYNEEAGIERAVRDVLEYLPTVFTDWECIVVNDGSKDRTGEILTRLGREHPNLRPIMHAQNQGYGRALATGMAAAKKELVFFTDGDRQFDIRELSDTVPLLANADVVFGYRVYRYDSVLRCFLSWVYNRLVRVLFFVRVRDVDCSWKLWKRAIADQLVLEARDFFIDTEMVARTRRLTRRIVEKGVRHYPRTAGHTTVRAGDIPRTLITVFRMWFKIHFGKAGVPNAQRAAAGDAVAPRAAEEQRPH